MAAFRVPDDLADKDLTLAQVREILDNRRKRMLVQNRIERLVASHRSCKVQLTMMDEREAELLKPAEDEASK